MSDIHSEVSALQGKIDGLLARLHATQIDSPSIWNDFATIITRCLWVAAHHGLRSIPRDPLDAAPYPLTTWVSTLWGHVHDLTAELGFPPAPGGPMP